MLTTSPSRPGIVQIVHVPLVEPGEDYVFEGAGRKVRWPKRLCALEHRACQLGIHYEIEWLGFVPNRELATEYRKADVFLSTVTGTALREAGLFGVPVVGYNADWVKHLLKHEDTALLVPVGDAVGLAREVARVLIDHGLRQRIADNFSRMAWERWDDKRIRWALQQTFEPGAA